MKIKIKILFISWFFLIGVLGAFSQVKSPAKEFKNVSLKIIHSKILNEDRRIFVYAPKGPELLKYPVLYLLDGSRSFTFKNALQNTKNNPHIIIGIDTSKNNRSDMIPCRGTGKAKKLLKFIVQELQPYVNKHYSTIERILSVDVQLPVYLLSMQCLLNLKHFLVI